MTRTDRPRLVVFARVVLVAGVVATALALFLAFVPRGPVRCLEDFGQGSEQTPPCPPFDQTGADRANFVVGTLLYGGPVLLLLGGLGVLVSWASREGRVEPPRT